MRAKAERVVLITGASSGIGQACALHLTRLGYRVYGTSRQGNLARRGPSPLFELIQMDVDDDASVSAGVDLILSREQRLDAVINNAGLSLVGAVEATTMAEARAQFETDFFGALRVCRAALPVMRQQRAGHVVNISSMAGQIALPFQAVYSAAKFALEGLTEALRLEVQPFGIQVVLVEPGDIQTGIWMRRRHALAAAQAAVYAEAFARALSVVEHDEKHGPAPDRVARRVAHILDTPHPRLHYPVGPAYASLALALKRALPAALFEWGLKTYYRQ